MGEEEAEMCAMEDTLSLRRLERFSLTHKFAGMGGATARRNVLHATAYEDPMSIRQKSSSDASAASATYLTAAELELGLPPCGGGALRPRTADSEDLFLSVNKHRRWEAIEGLLNGTDSGASVRVRSTSFCSAERSFEAAIMLPATTMLVPKGSSADGLWRARLRAEAHDKVYERPAQAIGASDWIRMCQPSRSGRPLSRLPLLYTRPDGPPPGVPAGSSLLGKNASLSASASDHRCIHGPAHATVAPAHDVYTSAWLPPDNARAGAWLQVDLGADCRVTHVSTRGRFPITELFPDSGRERSADWKQCVRLCDVVRVGEPGIEWVNKFRLSARSEGGRKWYVVGTFGGNTDSTTEVAHNLVALVGGRGDDGGLVCRYLRFEPLEFHGRPCLRVGVYGSAQGCALASEEEAPEPAHPDANAEHVVTYVVSGGSLKSGLLFAKAHANASGSQSARGGLSTDDGARQRQLGKYTRLQISSWRNGCIYRDRPTSARDVDFLHLRWHRAKRMQARAVLRPRGNVVRVALEQLHDPEYPEPGDEDEGDVHGCESDRVASGAHESMDADEDLELALALSLSAAEAQLAHADDDALVLAVSESLADVAAPDASSPLSSTSSFALLDLSEGEQVADSEEGWHVV
jgi:hypothetical protein